MTENSVVDPGIIYREALTGISALTNIEDAEPLLAPARSCFVDQFVFDSEDDIWDLVQHAETEIDTLDDIGGQDFIDIMEAFQTDVPDGIKGLDLDIKYNQFNFFDVPPGTKPKPDKPVVTAMKGALRVYGIAGDEQVFVSNGTEKTVVGMKYDKVAF
jgi:hypothetical protein